MAQLKATSIDGELRVNGNITTNQELCVSSHDDTYSLKISQGDGTGGGAPVSCINGIGELQLFMGNRNTGSYTGHTLSTYAGSIKNICNSFKVNQTYATSAGNSPYDVISSSSNLFTIRNKEKVSIYAQHHTTPQLNAGVDFIVDYQGEKASASIYTDTGSIYIAEEGIQAVSDIVNTTSYESMTVETPVLYLNTNNIISGDKTFLKSNSDVLNIRLDFDEAYDSNRNTIYHYDAPSRPHENSFLFNGPTGEYLCTLRNFTSSISIQSSLTSKPSYTTTMITFALAEPTASGWASLSKAVTVSITYNVSWYTGANGYYIASLTCSSASSGQSSPIKLENGKKYKLMIKGIGSLSSAGVSSSNINTSITDKKPYFDLEAYYITGSEGTIAIGNIAPSLVVGTTSVGCNSMMKSRKISLGYGGSTAVYLSGSTSAWTFVSDRRDKTHIKSITNSLDFINKLEPVTFVDNSREKYIKDNVFNEESYMNMELAGTRRIAGFIAQDVYQSLIDTYSTDNYASVVDYNKYDNPDPDEIDRYHMRYTEIIPFLTGAVQELSAKLDKATNKITELENTILALKSVNEQ